MKKNNFLDYDELTKSYNDQLNNKLRDFGTEHLKLWVPEENIVKSILNLISSALIHNKIIDIRVSKDTLNKKKLNEILNYSPNFSNFKITYEKNSYLLNYKKINSTELNKILIFFSKKKKYEKSLNLKKKKSSKKVIKIDKKKLKLLYFKNISTFKFIRSKKELIKNNNYDYIVKNKYYGLAIKLDAQEKSKIISINFYGDRDKIENFFLEKFCEKVLNLPLFEAFEHGVIKLEKSIRPNDINKFINGIISPVSVFQIFENIQNLIFKVWQLHKSQQNVQLKNLFDRYPSDDWMNTQYSKKKEIVEKSINDFENKYQIEELLYFDNIQDDCIRLTIGVKKKINDIKLAGILLLFEKFIRSTIDKRIEVFYTEFKDANKLRQKNLKI